MADRVNNEDSIARVYKFLTDYNKSRGDWTVNADANNDGTIIKSEFFSFIKKNFNNWNGEEKKNDQMQNDLINNFWASIDVNTTGKVGNTNISNVYALDDDEMKNIEKGMIVSQEVDNFVATLNPPQLLMSKKAQWKNSVRASLINKALDFARGQSLDNEDVFKTNLKGFLKDTYKATERTTNADYVANLALEKINVKGYSYGSDETLKTIISTYIQSIADKDVTFQDIYDTVTCLVNDYLATAGKSNGGSVGSSTAFDSYKTDEYGQVVTDENGNPIVSSRGTNSNTTPTSRLEQYGYLDGGLLNDLQMAVLTDSITSKIQEELAKDTYKHIYTAENKAVIDAMVAKFVDSKLLTATTDDFASLQNFNASEFINSTEFATMKNDIDKAIKDLSDAKKNLKQVLADKYTKKYQTVLQEVFGCSTKSEVEAVIDSLKTVDEVNAKLNVVTAKIKAEDEKPVDLNETAKELKKNNTQTGTYRMTFYIADDGSIQFIEYDGSENGIRRGAFSKNKHSGLNNIFSNKKSELEKSFQDVIDNLELSASEKNNLFNAAMYMAVSDESVLRSQYEMQSITPVIEALIDNYTKLLTKLSNDKTGNVRNYIKNYQNSSIVAGRTPAGTNYTDRNSDVSRGMDKYYMDDTTAGDDDWVLVSKQKDYSFSYNGASGTIIHMNDSEGDANATNKGLDNMLMDYINSYKNCIDPNRIIALFREAENTAFMKLNALTDHEKPSGTAVYGYGQSNGGGSDNFDTFGGTYLNCGSVLLEVMYEMEALIAREIVK